VSRRSWLAQSAHRTGAGPHADRRERRTQSTRRQCDDAVLAEHLAALDAAYAAAAEYDDAAEAAWLASHLDADYEAEADAAHEGSEREARERRP
jgi:hypothetical protein